MKLIILGERYIFYTAQGNKLLRDKQVIQYDTIQLSTRDTNKVIDAKNPVDEYCNLLDRHYENNKVAEAKYWVADFRTWVDSATNDGYRIKFDLVF